LLVSHRWPGNVRELRNAIERAMILEETALLTPLQPAGYVLVSPAVGSEKGPPPVAFQIPDEGISFEENERNLVVRALEKTNGNQTQAAPAAKYHPRYVSL
jgi:DNA-binding NtrC family response regulator